MFKRLSDIFQFNMTEVDDMILDDKGLIKFLNEKQDLIHGGCAWIVQTMSKKCTPKRWREVKQGVGIVYGNLISYLRFLKNDAPPDLDMAELVHAIISLERAVQCMYFCTQFFGTVTDPDLSLLSFLVDSEIPHGEEWEPEGEGWMEEKGETDKDDDLLAEFAFK